MDDCISTIKTSLSNLQELVDEISLENQNDISSDHIELGDLPYRVMHLISNPSDRVIIEEKSYYDELEQENGRLKARLSLLESGTDANVTMRIDEAVNNAQQIDTLKRMIADYKSREEKILVSLKKTAFGFREACMLLTGYRVDALKDNIYRLSLESQNGCESDPEERLFFEIKRDGSIILVENNYSRRFSRHVSTYLHQNDSYPAFLAAIVLDSFESSNNKLVDATQAMDISMSMDTTMVPNYHK